MERILVVDDEPQIHRFLEVAPIAAKAMNPACAVQGRQAMAEIARKPPDGGGA